MTKINTIVVVDTETTDLDPAAGAQIMEIGFVSLELVNGRWQYGPGRWHFIECKAIINPMARANHHIRPEQCMPGALNCFPRDVVVEAMIKAQKPGTIYAAHHAPFDRKFLPELDPFQPDGSSSWIDTCQVSRHLWPDAPRHSNQVLRYWLEAEPPPNLLLGLEAHRALYDAACSAAILERALREHAPERLIQLSNTPVLMKTCNFGKHRGQPWEEIPTDYLAWLKRSGDFYQNDPELRYTVDHHLNLRAAS